MPPPSDSLVSVPIQNIMNVLNTHLQWRAVNGPPRNHQVYHPSSFGKCLRKMQYELFEERGWVKGDKDKKANETLRIFDTGHSMHHRWAKYFEEIGILRGRWHCANPLCGLWDDKGVLDVNRVKNSSGVEDLHQSASSRKYGYENIIGDFKPKMCVCGSSHFHYHEVAVVDESLNFAGHADQILDFSNFDASLYSTGKQVSVLFSLDDLPKKPIVIDMKSINDRDFSDKLSSGMHFEYKVQLTIYINVLGLDQGVLMYENKNNSRVRVFEVKKNALMWEKIKEQASLMKGMIDHKKLPPPRPVSKTSTDCRYCNFRSKCHGEDGRPSVWDRPDLDEFRKKFYGEFG